MNRRGRSDFATQMMIALVIVSFLTMTFDIQTSGEGLTGTLRNGAQRLFSPVQSLAAAVVDPVVELVDAVSDLAGLRQENTSLRQELAGIRQQLELVPDLEAELFALQTLLDLRLPDESLNTTPARVISGGDSFDFAITIDKGTDHGVLVGNPVVDDQGNVVGAVTEAFAQSSTVLPILAPSITVSVVTTNGMRGFIQGAGSELRLEIFDAEGPVLQGEILLTAGSERYPPQLPVAKVTDSIRPEAGTRVIRAGAVQLASLERVRFVIVIQWPLAEELLTTTSSVSGTEP